MTLSKERIRQHSLNRGNFTLIAKDRKHKQKKKNALYL